MVNCYLGVIFLCDVCVVVVRLCCLCVSMLSGRVTIFAILEDSLDREIRERAKAKASERERKQNEEPFDDDDDAQYSTHGGKSASSPISSVPARTTTPESVRSLGPKIPLPKLRQTLTSKSIDEG